MALAIFFTLIGAAGLAFGAWAVWTAARNPDWLNGHSSHELLAREVDHPAFLDWDIDEDLAA